MSKKLNKTKDLNEKYEKLKRNLKKIEIVVKGHNIDFREWKEQIVSIEKEYTHFNKHKLNIRDNLMNVPIQYIDKVKDQLKIDVSNLGTQVKSEMTTKLKRIVICETAISNLKREFYNFIAKYKENLRDFNSECKSYIIYVLARKEELIQHLSQIMKNRSQIANIESKMVNNFKEIASSFDEFKNPVVNEITKIKNENIAYERELERYK